MPKQKSDAALRLQAPPSLSSNVKLTGPSSEAQAQMNVGLEIVTVPAPFGRGRTLDITVNSVTYTIPYNQEVTLPTVAVALLRQEHFI